MISLLNFIDTGFIITLALLLLISGGVMLYCYRRLNFLENSVIEHGKILQNFIMNYNNQMSSFADKINNSNNYNNSNNSNNLKNMNNINLEEMTNNIKRIELENKINVSDDEVDADDENDAFDDDDDDDEEDDDDDDDVDDYDNHDENVYKNIKIKEINNKKEFKKIDNEMDSLNIEGDFPLDISSMNLNNNDWITSTKVINLENDNLVEDKKNYNKMKVEDLKNLVLSKNLIENENIQKMKKNDLIKLLQENK